MDGRGLRRVLAVWLVARAACIAAAFLWPSPLSLTRRLARYDGAYYLDLAANGYPRDLPTALGSGNATGFFPGYSIAIKGLAAVTPLDLVWAAFVITLVAGALATLAVGALVTELTDRRTGTAAAITWTVLPMSFLLSTAYSEALFVLFTTCSLIYLVRDRPLLAGAFGSLAAVVRPIGLALVLVIAPYALQRRSLRAAVGAALAAVLPAIHLAFLAQHTGHVDAWWRSERVGWGAHFDAGLAAAKMVTTAILHPTRKPWFGVVAVIIVATLILLAVAFREQMPMPVWLFAALVMASALTSGVATYGSYPRIAYTAVPLMVPLSTRLQRLPRQYQRGLLIASIGAAAALSATVATSHAVIP